MERAEKLMLENVVARQHTFKLRSMDSGFQPAVIYREISRPQEPQALLDLMNEEHTLQTNSSAFVSPSTSALS